HAHFLAGGALLDAALQPQPLARAPATPLLVSLAPVELRNHEQPPALRRREMAGQRGDLSLQPLERQAGERVLILPHIHDVLLGPCDEWGKWPIERMFDRYQLPSGH